MKPSMLRFLAILLVFSVSVQLLNRRVEAQRTDITMSIGRPNIWSLAQAHYLLANLRQDNRSLKPTTPSLNPNSVNGARLDILRTYLGVDAQFNAAQGLKNQVAREQFQTDFARKQSAIARLDELSKEQLGIVREISSLNAEIAKLPPPPKASETPDAAIERDRATLTKTKEAKETLLAALAAQISTATTQAGATVNLSALSADAPFGDAAKLPTLRNDLADTKDIITSMLGSTATPAVNASMALDNHINLQYEMIAKQLTLLRDEIGPDERLVFLELPSSLYSVPKRDDDYVVQIEWNVAEYLNRCDDPATHAFAQRIRGAIQAAENEVKALPGIDQAELFNAQPPPVTDEYLTKLSSETDLNLIVDLIYAQAYKRLDERKRSLRGTSEADGLRLSAVQHGLTQLESRKARIAGIEALTPSQRADIVALRGLIVAYPELLEARWKWTLNPIARNEIRPANGRCSRNDSKPQMRVVDIIPRQSALNVNEGHGTQKGWGLSAQFLSLFGLGGKVSYERQRTHYEQFINQDIFASGFGKGLDRFGWTIGPVPGTKRLAPGPRTTFAILAIPNDTWEINLRATAIAYPKSKSPTNPDDSKFVKSLTSPAASFDIIIPNSASEGFWVDSVNYTPVRKGERVTAVLGGRYFSPLTGVLVDGVPLKRAVAIAKHESDSTTLPLAADTQGEYEYLNSNQIILSFKSQSTTFVGTPLITLVTPEKTSAINYFALRINYGDVESLARHSAVEPMFMDDFALQKFELRSPLGGGVLRAQLVGNGFRPNATICIVTSSGTDCDTNSRLINTGVYDISFNQPADPVWSITYRSGQQASAVTFDTDTDGLRARSPTIDSIENPATGNAQGLVDGGYVVIIRGKNLQDVNRVSFGAATVIPEREKHPNVLFVKVPKGTEGGVRVFLTAVTADGTRLTNILDFVTSGKAIFRYIPKPAAN